MFNGQVPNNVAESSQGEHRIHLLKPATEYLSLHFDYAAALGTFMPNPCFTFSTLLIKKVSKENNHRRSQIPGSYWKM